MKYLLLILLTCGVATFSFRAAADNNCWGPNSCPGGSGGNNGSSNYGMMLTGSNGANGNNNGGFIAQGCPAKCAQQAGDPASCAVAGCDCVTVQPSTDSKKMICISSQYLSSCGIDNITPTGACRGKNISGDYNNDTRDGTMSASAEACQQAVDNAVMTCDPNKSADIGAVMQMATGMQQALASATGASIAAACGKLGKVSAAASAATATYKGYCSYAYSKCQQACNTALSDPSAAQDKAVVAKLLRQCNGMQENIADASTAVMGLIGAKLNMQQCANMTTDCTLNPTAPSCVASVDCKNTTVATTNIVCICQSNPADSRCGNSNSSSLPGSFSGSANLASTGGSTTDGSLGQFPFGGDNGMGSSYNPTENPSQQQPAQNLAQGMQGGHNLGPTGNVNNAYTPPGAAGSSAGKANVLSGYYGGGGSGGFGSSGSGSGNYGGSGGGGYGGVGGLGRQNGLDLKQFLPGGAKDPARGIAGISGPDGITGPNSDIWQKVNTRYFSVSPSLLP